MTSKDLEKIKSILEQRQATIIKNIQDAKNEVENLNSQETNDEADIANIAIENIIEGSITKQQEAELKEIKYALSKIQNNAYDGICEMCDEDIGLDRIFIKPYARYCISCKEIIESQKK